LIAPPHRTCQHLEISLDGTGLGSFVLETPGESRVICFIPSGTRQPGGGRLVLRHTDFIAPAQMADGNPDTRELSVILASLVIEQGQSDGIRQNAAAAPILFLVTGVCRAGETPALPFLRYLCGPGAAVLAWIDFKDDADFERARSLFARELPEIVLRRAPRALWAGPSTVTSLLEGIGEAIAGFPAWQQLLLCSNRDVPLLRRAAFLTALDALRQYDYCGSRWNNGTADLWSPWIVPVATEGEEEEGAAYRQYPVRPEMTLRIEAVLNGLCPEDAVRSLRLTETLAARFAIAAAESHVGGATLVLRRMTAARRAEKTAFHARHALVAGRLWCLMSRRRAEICTGDAAIDLFNRWFHDIPMADECFFQSLAQSHAEAGRIVPHWQALYHEDAQVRAIGAAEYAALIAGRTPPELLARKEAGLGDYAAFLT
jgi:hypothetical protein